MNNDKLTNNDLLEVLNLISCISVICDYIDDKLKGIDYIDSDITGRVNQLKESIEKEFNW